MNWLWGPRLPDSEIQQRFPPEAMQAVFSTHSGDIRYLKKPLDAMIRGIETSSSEAQRSLLRELKMSGVVGFASTLLLVYGQREDTFSWCCEVLRLVHMIEDESGENAGGGGGGGGNGAMRVSSSSDIDSPTRQSPSAAAGVRAAAGASFSSGATTAAASTSSSLSSCIVPLLRAAASRSTDAEVMKKHSSLIVSAALLGLLPDHGADEPFSTHATLALETAQRLLAHLSAEDCSQCSPVAAAFLLRSSRHQIETFFAKESCRTLWKEAARLCLGVVQKASTYVRPKDITRITRALEHVLNHFYCDADDESGGGGGGNSAASGQHRNRPPPPPPPTTTTPAASGGGADLSSVYSNELRTALGQLVGEAARVVHCAANDGWLPISRAFFDRLVGAASASLRDPEVVATGAFAACFSSLPRVATVALRGGALTIDRDILPSIDALWDTVDRSVVPDAAATCNRDALVSVAEGLAAWLGEFHVLEPVVDVGAGNSAAPGGDGSPQLQPLSASFSVSFEVNAASKVEYRRIVWGAQRQTILKRVEATTLTLFDRSLFETNSTSRSNADDQIMSSWFCDLWRVGFFFAIMGCGAGEHEGGGEEEESVDVAVQTEFVRQMKKRRSALLSFVQGTANCSCPELLQLLHLVPEEEPAEAAAAAAATRRVENKEPHEQEQEDQQQRQKKNDQQQQPTTEADPLRRFHYRCRTTRRGAAPPEFVPRSLNVMLKHPCPVCAFTSVSSDGLPSTTASSKHHHHQQHRCSSPNNDFVEIERHDDDDDEDDANRRDSHRSRLEQQIKSEIAEIESSFHIANCALPFRFGSTRTLHRLVQILGEASARQHEHNEWQTVASSALSVFSSKVFSYGKKRLFADVEIIVASTAEEEASSGQKHRVVGHLASASAAEVAGILDRVCPYMRMRASDFYVLSSVFSRGRGWIWDDGAVLAFRDIFDEHMIRCLWEARDDVVARCIVGSGAKTQVTVPLLVVSAGEKKGDGDTASASLEQQQQKISTSSSSTITAVVSAAYLRWCVKQIFGRDKTIGVINDRVIRFFFAQECPKDFDSFAALVLSSSQ